MAEMLNDWFGNRFGLTLEHAIRVVQKVRYTSIDKLCLSHQIALPSTEVDTSGLDSDDRQFKTISNSNRRAPPSATQVFASPPSSLPPTSLPKSSSQFLGLPTDPLVRSPSLDNSLHIPVPTKLSSPESSSSSPFVEPHVAPAAASLSVPTTPPQKTRKIQAAGVEVVLNAGTVRNTAKWKEEHFNVRFPALASASEFFLTCGMFSSSHFFSSSFSASGEP